VALTFQTNGERALAERLLELLGARRVPITAFVVGNWFDANPDLAERILAGGHEIANHTYTHPTFPRLGPAAMRDEVSRCRDVLERMTGAGGTYFRPSGTANGTDAPAPAVLQIAAEAGYPVVLGYDVDPADDADPGAGAVAQATIGALRPGAIVSLHFGRPGTIDALPDILAGLSRRGLEPVTVSSLLRA
jgi:peptidoglycan/xylan/chitin deacetylase (PgdA/CDA1 family)